MPRNTNSVRRTNPVSPFFCWHRWGEEPKGICTARYDHAPYNATVGQQQLEHAGQQAHGVVDVASGAMSSMSDPPDSSRGIINYHDQQQQDYYPYNLGRFEAYRSSGDGYSRDTDNENKTNSNINSTNDSNDSNDSNPDYSSSISG